MDINDALELKAHLDALVGAYNAFDKALLEDDQEGMIRASRQLATVRADAISAALRIERAASDAQKLTNLLEDGDIHQLERNTRLY